MGTEEDLSHQSIMVGYTSRLKGIVGDVRFHYLGMGTEGSFFLSSNNKQSRSKSNLVFMRNDKYSNKNGGTEVT